MQQGSVGTKEQGDQIIHQFIQGFLDTRKKECKQLKEINLKWRKVVETRFFQTSDLKRLMSRWGGVRQADVMCKVT
jgi:hypothetical protein